MDYKDEDDLPKEIPSKKQVKSFIESSIEAQDYDENQVKSLEKAFIHSIQSGNTDDLIIISNAIQNIMLQYPNELCNTFLADKFHEFLDEIFCEMVSEEDIPTQITTVINLIASLIENSSIIGNFFIEREYSNDANVLMSREETFLTSPCLYLFAVLLLRNAIKKDVDEWIEFMHQAVLIYLTGVPRSSYKYTALICKYVLNDTSIEKTPQLISSMTSVMLTLGYMIELYNAEEYVVLLNQCAIKILSINMNIIQESDFNEFFNLLNDHFESLLNPRLINNYEKANYTFFKLIGNVSRDYSISYCKNLINSLQFQVIKLIISECSEETCSEFVHLLAFYLETIDSETVMYVYLSQCEMIGFLKTNLIRGTFKCVEAFLHYFYALTIHDPQDVLSDMIAADIFEETIEQIDSAESQGVIWFLKGLINLLSSLGNTKDNVIVEIYYHEQYMNTFYDLVDDDSDEISELAQTVLSYFPREEED
ncbi:armadillo (ARM) repeat-containing protein family [Trichomonas vaginalis G3]|uniref:armadillo (ARM) repeat-containing protein family n=1 Tax=Trichomonas vaginalis (strain ATCC PRA-98 / G3) TaxID=412133 RepID=UPI0021E5ED33|nr:armadillo (ARM) repeat-containing protein family [Trichomonas vaginalis G3]KAI5523781.1 armadillo (ARM) repeat-containing protein family [Trichomonas vaginalis G3]